MTIANRLLGVPIGSTMWVITFGASYAWLLNRAIDRDPEVRPLSFLKGLLAVAGFSSLLMVLQVTVLQQLDKGVPGAHGLLAVISGYLAIVGAAWSRAARSPRRPADAMLHAAILVYFGTLLLIGAIFDPATHRSTSLHQTYGPCHVKATDITGHVRDKFICAEDFDEDFTFACADKLPATGSEWYTVCGRPHKNFGHFMLGLSGLCLLGMSLYSFLLAAARKKEAAKLP
jgi:hypothetical protein